MDGCCIALTPSPVVRGTAAGKLHATSCSQEPCIYYSLSGFTLFKGWPPQPSQHHRHILAGQTFGAMVSRKSCTLFEGPTTMPYTTGCLAFFKCLCVGLTACQSPVTVGLSLQLCQLEGQGTWQGLAVQTGNPTCLHRPRIRATDRVLVEGIPRRLAFGPISWYCNASMTD